jgi:hypothetical protein
LASQKKATEAMSRINSAWAMIEELNSKGQLGIQSTSTTSENSSVDWQFKARRPGNSECSICGSAPAKNFKIKGINVLLIGIVWPGYEGNLCKACAKAFTYESLRSTLLRGWWGVWFFITPFIIINLLGILRQIGGMKEPTFRDFRVITPYEMPLMSGRMPLKEPKNIVVATLGIISVVIALLILNNDSTNSVTSNSPGSMSSGVCWTMSDNNGQVHRVDCGDLTAVYRTLATSQDSNSCPLGTVQILERDLNGLYTCLELKQ